jgi:lipase ATG15
LRHAYHDSIIGAHYIAISSRRNLDLRAARTERPSKPTYVVAGAGKSAPIRELFVVCLSNFTLRSYQILRHILVPGAKARHRLDLADGSDNANALPVLLASAEDTSVERLLDRQPVKVESLLRNAQIQGRPLVLGEAAWTLETVSGPNVTDRQTVLNLALMASDAYVPNVGDPAWLNLTSGFNRSQSFGWDTYGIRGHVFTDQDNSTIVVAIKGTERGQPLSPPCMRLTAYSLTAAFDGAGTSTKDKINDNLFFSCCCAQQGHFLWHQVCSCATNTYQCDKDCLIRELIAEDHYYRATLDLYSNVTELYPNSTIWLTGHSLGGALSSLLGLTYGHPAVTFEAPPDALAAERLGLPLPPGAASHQRRLHTGASHFGNTADPVYMGSCSSAYSLCSMWGYAFESQCHTGTRCVYDTVTDKGWWSSIVHHAIDGVIKDVIKAYEEVPKCEPEDTECSDCFNWRFDGKVTTTTAASSSSTAISTSKSYTRTETCKTPGWWHCLDKTSSSGRPFTTPASTTTSTCHTPGWFGCKDPTSTTIPTSAATLSTTSLDQ